jgi:hypothetical protein
MALRPPSAVLANPTKPTATEFHSPAASSRRSVSVELDELMRHLQARQFAKIPTDYLRRA